MEELGGDQLRARSRSSDQCARLAVTPIPLGGSPRLRSGRSAVRGREPMEERIPSRSTPMYPCASPMPTRSAVGNPAYDWHAEYTVSRLRSGHVTPGDAPAPRTLTSMTYHAQIATITLPLFGAVKPDCATTPARLLTGKHLPLAAYRTTARRLAAPFSGVSAICDLPHAAFRGYNILEPHDMTSDSTGGIGLKSQRPPCDPRPA